MHYHHVEDDGGDVVDLVPFCCDSCHRDYCRENGLEYGGWNGCHEGSDSAEFCANCGTYAGGAADCDCQTNNVVVGRFLSKRGERCRHRNWIQLPASRLVCA
jgi:hypothetical protein